MPRRYKPEAILIASLINHLRPSKSIEIFPRMLGIGVGDDILQKQIDNPEVYINAALSLKGDVFISVYSDYEIMNRVITTIFLDIDAKKLDEAYNILQNNLALLDALGIDPGKIRLYFSGKKGFHIYIDFRPLYLPASISFKSLILAVFKRLGLMRYLKCDPSVLGDLRRLARVPYTRHLASNYYCIPIDPSESISEILEFAKNPFDKPRLIKVNFRAGEELRKAILEYIRRHRIIAERIILRLGRKEGKERIIHETPPCIKHWLEMLRREGKIDHYARLNLAIYFLRMGKSLDYIDALFRTYLRDYNPRRTRYQIEYARKYRGRGLLMWSCPHLQDLGLCPLEEPQNCKFWPSINRIMGWR